MWEIFVKIWFFIILLPIFLAQKGYEVLKEFLNKRGYALDWISVSLAILIILSIALFLLGYGYR